MENELKRASITKQLTKIILVLGFLLVSLWSFASNSAYAQEKKFTFEFNKTSIKEILGYIEKHSEFIFMYRNDLLDTSRKVSVKIVGQEIEEVIPYKQSQTIACTLNYLKYKSLVEKCLIDNSQHWRLRTLE